MNDQQSTQPESAPVPVLELIDVCQSFEQGERKIEVLRGVNAAFAPGKAVALIGPSGSGKSTLLHLTGLLEQPVSGEVRIDGENCIGLSDKDRTAVRRRKIGFVYQFHHLLPEFSALENIVIPQMIAGEDRKTARENATRALEQLGLGDRGGHRPGELSGGEQQRVAIARSLANNPRVLLADEPTGNLDPETSERVFSQLIEIIRDAGLAALIATHNMELAERMDRILTLESGVLVEVAHAR